MLYGVSPFNYVSKCAIIRQINKSLQEHSIVGLNPYLSTDVENSPRTPAVHSVDEK